MDVDMTAKQVVIAIQQLNAAGESLNKKKIKNQIRN